MVTTLHCIISSGLPKHSVHPNLSSNCYGSGSLTKGHCGSQVLLHDCVIIVETYFSEPGCLFTQPGPILLPKQRPRQEKGSKYNPGRQLQCFANGLPRFLRNTFGVEVAAFQAFFCLFYILGSVTRKQNKKEKEKTTGLQHWVVILFPKSRLVKTHARNPL